MRGRELKSVFPILYTLGKFGQHLVLNNFFHLPLFQI